METQASISQWATEIFGEASSDFRVATRANEEMAELLRAVATGDYEKAMEEAADVLIVLCRVAERRDIDVNGAAESAGRIAGFFANLPPDKLATMANGHLADMLRAIVIDANPEPEIGRLVCYLAFLVHDLSPVGPLTPLGLLWDHATRKMQTNRGRTWKLDGTGHGYHVRAGE